MEARTLRRLCLVVIGLLYVASVPWYRTSGEAPAMWFGLPDWVAVSVLCYVGVAIVNSVAWLNTEVPEANDPSSEDEPEGAP